MRWWAWGLVFVVGACREAAPRTELCMAQSGPVTGRIFGVVFDPPRPPKMTYLKLANFVAGSELAFRADGGVDVLDPDARERFSSVVMRSHTDKVLVLGYSAQGADGGAVNVEERFRCEPPR